MKNDKLVTTIYDKRDDFVFKTVKILHFDSNVHISIFRNVLMNGLKRIERLSSSVNYLIDKFVMWYIQAFMQGYPASFIKKKFNFIRGSK